MLVVDSCGWLEVLTGGPLGETYRQMIEGTRPDRLLVPVVVVYEVCKVARARLGEGPALEVALRLQQHPIVPVDASLAVQAAEFAVVHGLAMADALVYAAARSRRARLATSDADLKGLPGVEVLPKPGASQP